MGELWENVLARRQQFRRMPDCRLPLGEYHHPDPAHPDTTYGTQAAVVDGFTFDWAARRIPKSTADSTDIVQWLALEVAYKALADSGVTPEKLPSERTGVVLGNSLTGENMRSGSMRLRWPYVRKALRAAAQARGLPGELVAQLETTMETYYKSVFEPITEDSLAGNLSNTIAGRICNSLNLHGGGYVVDGACSSSLLAVTTAASALERGDLDVAFAGGVDVSLDTLELIGFSKAGALTTQEMTVYDRRASGFVPGEGCGMVVLKRLADARRDGDRVYAVVRGWGISSDGRGGMMAPSVAGQALALGRAYDRAGYPASSLDFVEGHGTGTRLGDKTELEAIATAVQKDGPVSPRSVGVTSFKSVFGHTKAAAGIGGFIKAAIAVNRRVVPPTSGCQTPSPTFDRAAASLYPVMLGSVRPHDAVLRAGVSAMGFGGINSHVTLESGDAPDARIQVGVPERSMLVSKQEAELFPFSASTVQELRAQVARTLKDSEGMSQAELVDLAAECARRTSARAARAAVVAGNLGELKERLEALLTLPDHATTPSEAKPGVFTGHSTRAPRLGFLLPGQGSQRLGMARVLVHRFTWAADMLRQADRALEGRGLPSLESLMHPPTDRAASPQEHEEWLQRLTATEVAQPAICVASALWLEWLRRMGLTPVAVGGHSLGELTAFYAAGAFDFEELVRLAGLRGHAMAARSELSGTMASLGCPRDVAQSLCASTQGDVVVANINGPNQTVVSGTKAAVAQVLALAATQGIQARQLPVSNAFHSRLVSGAADAIRQAPLADTTPALTARLYSACTGARVESGQPLRGYFAEQVLAQVDFLSMVRALCEDCDVLVEVGPGKVLSRLAADIVGKGGLPCLATEGQPGTDRDLPTTLATLWVQGQPIAWDEYYAHRLTRTFSPAHQKHFIQNLCERPMTGPTEHVEPAMLPVAASPTVQGPLAAVAQKAGHSIAEYLTQLGALMLSGAGPTALASATPAAPHVAPQQAPALRTPVESPPAAREPRSTERILLELVSARTGFPIDSLRTSMRLLDDLNLDSIKAGELVANAAKACGVAGSIDPAALANATLTDIARALGQAATTSAPPAAKPSTPAPAGVDVAARLLDQVERRTGFPRSTLTLKLRLLDDLNLDSIKAAEVVAEVAKGLGVAGQIDPGPLANATLEDIAAELSAASHPAPAQGLAPRQALQVLVEKAREVAGFEVPEGAELCKDVGLGEAKAWQIIAEAAQALGVDPHLDREVIVHRSLRDIAGVLDGLVKQRSGEATAPPATTPNSGAPPATNWVRSFVVNYVPEPLLSTSHPVERQEDKWEEAQVLLVTEPSESELAHALSGHLSSRGARVHSATFAEAISGKLSARRDFNKLVAVLPRGTERVPSHEGLKHMVLTLSAIAAPPPASAGPRRRTTIAFLQLGALPMPYRSTAGARSQASAVGFASSLHLERKDLRVRVLDFPPAADPKAVSELTANELVTSNAFEVAVFDDHLKRHAPRPALAQPHHWPRRAQALRPREVVLVTGGAKGITAECALALARATGSQMVLVGSSATGGEISRTLERFSEAGLKCRYYTCDVSDGRAVADLVARVRQELGPIAAILHGAGLNRPRRAEMVSVDAAFDEVRPKVLGMTHLLQALEDTPPRLVLGLTSIIGVAGMPGNAWYAFSNETLDLMLRQYASLHPGVEVQTIAYSVWDEVGMGAKLGSITQLARLGVGAIPLTEGVRRFLQAVEHTPTDSQLVVSSRLGSLDTWRPVISERPAHLRFLEKVEHLEPQVELVARAHLTMDKDPYLRDHVFKGSPLLPTVFGLEAMGQAVAAVLGRQSLGPVRIENISLTRPIVVDPAHGAHIELRALVAEHTGRGSPMRVHVEIGTEQTGFTRAHFAADFVLDHPMNRDADLIVAGKPVDLDPSVDLYGRILFQGSRFQRISRVFHLDADGCVFEVQSKTQQENARVAFAGDTPLVLPDPFALDALLQSGLLSILPDLALPVRIQCLELWPTNENLTSNAQLRIVAREPHFYRASVTLVDAHGSLMARITACDVQIIERKADLPTPAELVDPSARDEHILRAELARRAQSLGVEAPTLAAAHLPLTGHDKDERHERELPLLLRTAEAATGGSNAKQRS